MVILLHDEGKMVMETGLIANQEMPFDTSILAGTCHESTIAMYKRDFMAYLRFAGTKEMALTPSTLARWRVDMANNSRKSPKTINRMLSAVRKLMKQAASQGYVEYVLVEQFKHIEGVKESAMLERMRPKNRVRIEPSDMRRVSEKPDLESLVGMRDAAIIHTLASSGLRVSEMASLKRNQIRKIGQDYLVEDVIGKKQKETRSAYLSREAYDAIMAWLAARRIESEFIFTGFEGKSHTPRTTPLSAVSIWRIIKSYAESCGLEHVKPHDMRRFVGTQVAAHMDIRKAQKALGHKNIETTAQNYVLDDLEPGLTNNLY